MIIVGICLYIIIYNRILLICSWESIKSIRPKDHLTMTMRNTFPIIWFRFWWLLVSFSCLWPFIPVLASKNQKLCFNVLFINNVDYSSIRYGYVLFLIIVSVLCARHLVRNGSDYVQNPRLIPGPSRKEMLDLGKARKSLKVN